MVKYPDLFQLAEVKHGSITSHVAKSGGVKTWEWGWIRELPSNCEVEQANNMRELLNNLSLLENSDQWTWENKNGGNFSVKDLRMELQNMIQGPINSPPSLWNTWAPLKVNYFLWRAHMDRVATKMALAAHCCITSSLFCDRCSQDIEDSNHVLVSYLWSRCVWWHICGWIRVPVPSDSFLFG